jgi:hypothetical protein
MLFPKLANDDRLIKKGIIAYMRKNKMGDVEPPSQEERENIRNQYAKDTIFYTESIETIGLELVVSSHGSRHRVGWHKLH